MARIGVAISGGGYRATMWGIGALLYLADTGRHKDVVAISSVSGGSVANGVVAHETDYRQDPGADFAERVRPLIRHCARTGLFFWGPSTNRYVRSLFALAGLALLTLLAGVVATAVDGLRLVSGVLLGAGLLLLAGALLYFERRSVVVDKALAREFFHRDGAATGLAAVRRSVDHVFCTTELQSGDHFYFSPAFVYGYRFGAGEPGDLPLSTAVQASACLPGAFAVRRLPADRHHFTPGADPVAGTPTASDMVLTDGGVYDNMADQWLVGLDERARRPVHPPADYGVDEILVVNASAGMTWEPFRASRIPVVGELLALIRIKSVMYDVSTNQRRSTLVQWSDRAVQEGGPVGALVHIAQSPYRVADAYANAANAAGGAGVGPELAARAARADEVLDLLGRDEEQRAVWRERTERSRTTKTVLRKLGPDTTADLLLHAYTLAACNLHVLLGYPLPAALPKRQYFLDLAAGSRSGS
ncbi:patatin-like phospholipase family protein [Kitasatospora sp. CM 4170]|uniref:Patatin-like phospholipase family protein n=1 Tax=Kitasatospora aburaviensis TaxID=67265 RepID=A0ABW1FBJ6_9ACTN|nr:patatin-like phospholipase family protein [Kitasatospora sp. CM 4170]WNM44249.1 patatin-like phospholipase family protein [Kitasatospora sp. CM 4170]